MNTEGRKSRKWSKEEKLRIVRRYMEENLGRPKIAKQEGIASGMLYTWIKKYLEQGESGLENQKKPGNPFSALHTSKGLSEEDRLRLTVAKQQVEIARLKNGYLAEGSGASKVFVTLNGKSIKS